MREPFVPRGGQAPKTKDAGIVELVRRGWGVYNARSRELILLPLGVRALEDLARRWTEAFFEAGLQECDAGSDEGLRSLAERYVKEDPERGAGWFERRGRTLCWAAWRSGAEETIRLGRDLFRGLARAPLFAYEEAVPSGRRFVLAGPGVGGEGIVEGLACPCGFRGSRDASAGAPGPGSSLEGEPMEEIRTPGATTIVELCRQVGCVPEETMKTMFYAVEAGGEVRIVAAFIPGHLPISLPKLGRALGGTVRRATPEELARSVGEVAGFCGPVGLPPSVLKIADPSVLCAPSLVVGANRVDYHLRGARYGRDFEADRTADLVELAPGGACPFCGAPLGAEFHRVLGGAELPDRPVPAEGISARDREGTRVYPHLFHGELSLERALTTILENETMGGAAE